MELLTRQVDRVGVFRPLVHDGPDRLFDLLRARYRLSQDPATVYGLDYHEASAVQAEQGTDELVSRLVDRFHQVARDYEVVLVLGTDFADTQLPDELAVNARLANEFGASVIPVVGGRKQTPESVHAETRNAYRAYEALGCDVLAMVVNRVAAQDREEIGESLAAHLPVPTYVLPDEPALSAPTVSQIAQALGGEVLLGDDAAPRATRWTSCSAARCCRLHQGADPGLSGRDARGPRGPRRGVARRAQRRRPRRSRASC